MNIKRNTHLLAMIAVTGLFLLANCTASSDSQQEQGEYGADSNDSEVSATETSVEPTTCVAVLRGASGSNVTGTATFTEAGDASVELKLFISNATPGSHAVHLHENGDCSATDAASAGGHWNPTDVKHGRRGSGEFHKGDIANVTVDDEGNGSLDLTIQGWTIGGAASSDILNKAVIIHAGADDFTSQPSGAAGDRVACGVIEREPSEL